MGKARRYGDLLNRIELQMANKRAGNGGRGKRKRNAREPGRENATQRDRAVRLVKEGAYRKAIAAVSDDSLPLSNEENRMWADKLHTRSRNPVEACSRGDPTQPASDDPTDEAEPGDDGYIHPLSVCGLQP